MDNFFGLVETDLRGMFTTREFLNETKTTAFDLIDEKSLSLASGILNDCKNILERLKNYLIVCNKNLTSEGLEELRHLISRLSYLSLRFFQENYERGKRK